jgi:hypothetical protein
MRRSSAFLALPVVFAFGCSDQPTRPSDALALSPVFAHAPAAGFSYAFGIEVGFPGVPSAVAKNGDRIDISLNVDDAPFTFHPKAISGGGDFTIRNAAGAMLSTGTWAATKPISFQSYGSTDVGGGLFLFGGSLQMHITLSTGEKAILRLTCTDFGNPPPGVSQGMALQVVGGNHFTAVWPFPAAGPTQGFTFFVEN